MTQQRACQGCKEFHRCTRYWDDEEKDWIWYCEDCAQEEVNE